MRQPRAVLVVAGTAAVLALVSIGVVRTGERGATQPRASAVHVASEPRRAVIELCDPGVVAPVAAPAPPAPAPRPETAAPPVQTGGRLLGTVLRPDGAPAADARVLLGRMHAECADDGTFELLLLDPLDGAGLDLVAHEAGHEPALLPSFGAGLDPRGENHARVVLGEPTLTLAGRVETTDGAPVKDWTVELDGLDPLADFGLRESVRTDVDGAFTLTDVPAGVHCLRVFREARESAWRSTPVAAGETGVKIVVGQF